MNAVFAAVFALVLSQDCEDVSDCPAGFTCFLSIECEEDGEPVFVGHCALPECSSDADCGEGACNEGQCF